MRHQGRWEDHVWLGGHLHSSSGSRTTSTVAANNHIPVRVVCGPSITHWLVWLFMERQQIGPLQSSWRSAKRPFNSRCHQSRYATDAVSHRLVTWRGRPHVVWEHQSTLVQLPWLPTWYWEDSGIWQVWWHLSQGPREGKAWWWGFYRLQSDHQQPTTKSRRHSQE